MLVMDVPFSDTRSVPSPEDNRGAGKGEKREIDEVSGRDGWNLEIGQDQIENQVYTRSRVQHPFLKSGKRRGFYPVAALSFQSARANLRR